MTKVVRDIMGMPVAVEVVGENAGEAIEAVFGYFEYVDRVFSPYKPESEISRIDRGELSESEASEEVREVLRLSVETKGETGGYFDIRRPDGRLDPSGLVKGWAIKNAARLLESLGHRDYAVDAGGDIQTGGVNPKGEPWSVGIRSPFNQEEIVKVVYPRGRGVATSGTYIRGEHIYDPTTGRAVNDVASLTVIGPDVYEADRFATAAFAMGRRGIEFIERRPGFEAYQIDHAGQATYTSGFHDYT